MNKALRCEERDTHGHRCNRKKGHEKIKPTDDKPKDVQRHSAFGHEW